MIAAEVVAGSPEHVIVKLNHAGRCWEVSRTLDDFIKLHKQLPGNNALISCPKHKGPSLPIELEVYLQAVLSHYQEKIWCMDCLMTFLDSSPIQSPLMLCRIGALSHQMQKLQEATVDLLSNQKDLHMQYLELRDSMRQFSNAVKSGKELVSADFDADCQSADASEVVVNLPHLHQVHNRSSRLSFISVITADSAISAADAESTPPNEDSYDDVVTPRDRAVAALSADSNDGPPTDQTLVYPLPSCQQLPKESFPTDEECAPYDQGFEFVLKAAGPTEKQLQQRDSAISWLRRQIRIALGSSTYEIGLHATHCLLPDDPIKLDIVLSKSLLLSWHVLLCERLHGLVDKAGACGGTLFIPPDEDEAALDPFFNENVTLLNHTISGVSHTKQNLSHTVHLTIDSISIEIVANNRNDFCVMSFLEEVDGLVGRRHLFKKTFLLVRAWWAFETPSYIGTSIRHYLSDVHLMIMLSAIFNRYSELITSPLQALHLFLAEYAHYDGNCQVISIQGLVGFQTRASNQPSVIDAQEHHFLSASLLDKYWSIFNVNVQVEADSSTVSSANHQKRPSNSSDEGAAIAADAAEAIAVTVNGASISSDMVKSPTTPVGFDPLVIKEGLKQLSVNNLHHFDRSSFNILHPFNHTNMITEKLSVRRVNRILKAFQMGANNLAFFVKRVKEGNADAAESISNYFPNVLASYHNRANPADETSLEDLLLFKDGITKMGQCVDYYDLIMEAVVSDGALQLLAMEILATKGPLPVGEIGKILADITSIPNLSQKLKEKFGGLKKFLELFPVSFVISNDHPFNPNVLLRSSLSPEHLEMIDKGMFPPQLLVRPKKASGSKKKKAAAAAAFPSLIHNSDVTFRSDFSSPAVPIMPSATSPNGPPPSASNGGTMASSAASNAQYGRGGMQPSNMLNNGKAAGMPMQMGVGGGGGLQGGVAMQGGMAQPPMGMSVKHQQLQSRPQAPSGRAASKNYSPYYDGSGGYNQQPQYGYNRQSHSYNQPAYNQYGQVNYGDRGGSQYGMDMYNAGNSFNSMESSGHYSHNSSATNSYNSSNNMYVSTLLQAMIPPSEGGGGGGSSGGGSGSGASGYSNSFLSQLRMDSVEVGNSFGSQTSNASPNGRGGSMEYSEGDGRYLDGLLAKDERKDSSVGGSFMSRLF